LTVAARLAYAARVFVGHLAAGLMLKARVREAPLAALLAGGAFLDLVHGALVIAGVEHVVMHDPPTFANMELVQVGYSHSLTASVFYSVAAALLGARWWRSRAAGVAVGLAVFSHFVLDVLTHQADMPLLGLGVEHDVMLGTGLALHPLAFFVIEAGFCLLAWALYDAGNRRLLLTMLVLLGLWANNVFGFALPPPPPEVVQGMMVTAGFALAGAAIWWAARRGGSAG
jgi:membrane-bound metal-dependent hydrolase YbcI (DUF457 family)